MMAPVPRWSLAFLLLCGCNEFVAAESLGAPPAAGTSGSEAGASSGSSGGVGAESDADDPSSESASTTTSGLESDGTTAAEDDAGGVFTVTGVVEPQTSSSEGTEESDGGAVEPITCATLALPEGVPRVCATASSDSAEVAFFNDCESQTVSVYWVDYNCNEIFYFDVDAGDTATLFTFATHPWRVRDAATDTLLAEIEVTDAGPSSASVLGR